MATKPNTRRQVKSADDPVFAAIAKHKALVREYVRCVNRSSAARSRAKKKHRKSLEGAALLIAAAEDAKPEYDQFIRAGNAERKAAIRMARLSPTTTAAPPP